MSFIEHLKQASRTVASWPKWKREVLGTIKQETPVERAAKIAKQKADDAALYMFARKWDDAKAKDEVIEQLQAEYWELACAVWCQPLDEFIENPVDHAETCKEATRCAKLCVVEDSVYKAIVHLSAASTEIKHAYRAIHGEQP